MVMVMMLWWFQQTQTPWKASWKFQDDFQVDFRARNSVSSVLGFRNQVYEKGIHESQNVVNILSINSILVNVDVIGGCCVNGRMQNTIYSFFPNVSPGYKIVENSRNLVYLPVILDKINKMETVVTDQTESSWIFVEKTWQSDITWEKFNNII